MKNLINADFIDDDYINKLLKNSKKTTDAEINEILDKADRQEGLKHGDIAVLLNITDKKHLDRIFKIAKKIKEHIYGERVVIFAPIYISDYCINKCEYCGFNCDNDFERKKLTQDELKKEVEILVKMGHKRLALEAGEDPANCSLKYILECMKTIYDMKFENGEIRRINVNIAATSVEDYKKLKEIGIGTYILFQETYHKQTYEKIHISGPKSNYDYHSTAFDRAMEAGIDDVGGGVLFGFHDYRYEILGLMLHNEHLEQKYGVGFHTISVPRICNASGLDREKYKHIVDDETFKKIVAIIRIAVPFTGMIISTRENAQMRKELINIGISQVSAGSSVEVGGYNLRENNNAQFSVADDRSTNDVVSWLMDENLVPSFCTACYRKCRTGDRFMSLAKSGNIKNVCLPNALMTLKEYSLDYGDSAFKHKTNKLIENKLKNIENQQIKDLLKNNLELLENGERDLFL